LLKVIQTKAANLNDDGEIWLKGVAGIRTNTGNGTFGRQAATNQSD